MPILSMVDVSSIFIFGATAYMALLSWLGKREIKRVDKLEEIASAHDKRLQKREDIDGTKLDLLEKKMDKIEQSIENLSMNIHKEKNQEAQLVNALHAITKVIERLDKHD
jgi:TolA-binding protein